MINKNITNGGIYMALIKCPECKKKISDVAEKCPNCGKTITEADIGNAYEKKRKGKKRKKIAIIIIAIIVVIAICGAVTYYFVQQNETRIEEQRKYEEKKKAEEKAEQKKIQEEKEKRESKRKFVRKSQDLISQTDDVVSDLSKSANKITSTWLNCIYKDKDKETNKWTLKKNGKFKDFSTAVMDCVEDTIYGEKINNEYSDFTNTLIEWRNLKNDEYIKSEYEEIIEDIDEYTTSICNLYALLAQPTGSYEEFLSSVNEAQNYVSQNAEGLSYKLHQLIYG